MTKLPEAFLHAPLAHRGLHDAKNGVAENSEAAVAAAIQAGYGIEIDLQRSLDDQAVVFHDDTLDRMTDARGLVAARTMSELRSIDLVGGGTIPSLIDVLDLVAGRVPLLIEIKDNTAQSPGTPRPLERCVAAALASYRGPVAVMSFNPHAIASLQHMAPQVALGLTTCSFDAADFGELTDDQRQRLRSLDAFDAVGATFISHDFQDLASMHVARIKKRAFPVLCWTIRSHEQETRARQTADNITFEGYRAALP
ncbi:MAG: glycerophosphodiester phosphodiesterase family protein [Pseudomonadota bacterium]